MSARRVVAEYCRLARIYNSCMVHTVIHHKYDSYEYDRDVPVIAMKIYHMLVVYDETHEEEIVEALEALKLGPTPYVDLLEILGEFFIKNAATIYTHLNPRCHLQKN